jgi:hypothetical protein
LLCPGLFFSFVIIFTQTVRLLERVISPSQGRYLNTGQHKHRINAHTDIHALSGIRNQDPRVRAGEDSLCLKPRCHGERRTYHINKQITNKFRGFSQPASYTDRGPPLVGEVSANG